MRRDVTFTSQGAELRGWLYEPNGPRPWPLVVMTHGFSATRGMVADKFAERFRDAGLAVLLYDQHGFGDSAGEPRQRINPWVQARGYRDAIAFAMSLPEIDAKRIGLWGDSYSAGVAVAVAGTDRRVAALVAQIPSLGADAPPADPDGALRTAFEATLAGEVPRATAADELEGPIPVVSDDQETKPSALKPITAYRWFIEYGTRPGMHWVNEITRERPKAASPWRPGLVAPGVTCPTQFLVAPDDEMPGSRPPVSRAVYERLGGVKEWVEVRGGHFGLLYFGSAEFEHAAAAQARFLAAQLRAATGPAASP